jgi:hypothetical protein
LPILNLCCWVLRRRPRVLFSDRGLLLGFDIREAASSVLSVAPMALPLFT